MEVSAQRLSAARDEFRHFLASPTQESDWQRLFSVHPYVFSTSLPLRIEPADIVPFGRPGRDEPDFIFYPRDLSPVPYYGVIELKKPSSQIVSIVRTDVAILSREAETAIQQVSRYSNEIVRYAPVLADDAPMFLGNRAHLFVVIGMSQEISEKLSAEVYREIVERRLPANLQLIPFDTLLADCEYAIP